MSYIYNQKEHVGLCSNLQFKRKMIILKICKLSETRKLLLEWLERVVWKGKNIPFYYLHPPSVKSKIKISWILGCQA